MSSYAPAMERTQDKVIVRQPKKRQTDQPHRRDCD